MYSVFSLHKITDYNIPFCKVEYSKFKFGDGLIAEKYGRDLANGFIENEMKNKYDGTKIVVVSSPYAHIPTATFYMKNHFIDYLNKWLIDNGFDVVEESKIYRNTTYKEDYGALSAEERYRLISNDSFYVDEKFLSGKKVLFMDDIRITGSHEKMIVRMCNTLRLNCSYYLLYYAELINHDIPPQIENHLNYAKVKSLKDLDSIIESETFKINTRIVKFILNANESEFRSFIKSKDASFLKSLFFNSIGNAYHKIEAYRKNYSILKEKLIL